MNTFVLGNAVATVGCLIMVAIGLLKKKSHILIAQVVQCCFIGFSNLILGGISGFISNIVTILRNLVFVKYPITPKRKAFFIALQALLSLRAMSRNPVTWLPLISGGLFTWFLDTTDTAKLKLVILAGQVMWLIYDLYYRNYVAAAFDLLTILSTGIGILLIRKSN